METKDDSQLSELQKGAMKGELHKKYNKLYTQGTVDCQTMTHSSGNPPEKVHERS